MRDGSVTVASSAAARRRLLVIFNPIAGRGARAKLARALAALERLGVAVTLRETGAPGDAEAFAREASSADFDGIVIAGGDGTVNEAVNGLMTMDAGAAPNRAQERPALAVVPGGSTNVFARA
ncbi:MAG TPA: acylglycerol kinase family protein, partial [Stellaceae bacterium]|nr:acylglycerol kinase family protein [Stellaceae bacterium]